MSKSPFSPNILGEGKPNINFEVDFSNSTWNTTGSHQLLEVTGLARVKLLIYFKTTITSASTYADLYLGIPSNDDELRTYINTESITAGDFWGYSGSGSGYSSFRAINDYTNGITHEPIMDFLSSDIDIEYTIQTQPITGGTMQVFAWWQALTNNGNVTQGDGS